MRQSANETSIRNVLWHKGSVNPASGAQPRITDFDVVRYVLNGIVAVLIMKSVKLMRDPLITTPTDTSDNFKAIPSTHDTPVI